MTTKCEFVECNIPDATNNINDFNLLLIGVNELEKISMVEQFIFENKNNNLGNNDNHMFKFIKTVSLAISNYKCNVDIKFIIKNIVDLFSKKSLSLPNLPNIDKEKLYLYDAVMFVFNVNQYDSFNYIQQFYEKIIENNSNLLSVHFVGINSCDGVKLSFSPWVKEIASDNILKKDFAEKKIKFNDWIKKKSYLKGHYYNEIDINNKNQIYNLFSFMVEKFFIHILHDSKIFFNQIPPSIISNVIESQITKKKLENQVKELNEFINHSDTKNKLLNKRLYDLSNYISEKNNNIEKLGEEVNILKSEKDKLLTLNNNKNKEIIHLNKEIVNLKKENTDLNRIDTNINKLINEINENKNKIIKNEEIILNQNNTIVELNELNELNNNNGEIINELNLEITKLKILNNKKTETIKNSESKIVNLKENINNFVFILIYFIY